MQSIVIFDLDNTLTDSRQSLSAEMAELLRALMDKNLVAVISGASFDQFGKQVLAPLSAPAYLLPNLFILPSSGAELYVYDKAWKRLYAESLTPAEKDLVQKAFMKALDVTDMQLSGVLEDRDSMMNYAALGQDAPLEAKHAWDPYQTKRRELIAKLAPNLPGIQLEIAGTTSINITRTGIDKAYGIRKLLNFIHLDPSQVTYVGDALYDGGNDHVVKSLGVKTVATKGPDDTKRIIQGFLGSPEALEAKDMAFRPYAPYQSLEKTPIAFFCSEYALDEDAGMYAGGLGVLAADMLFEAADEGLPFAAIGLWYGGPKEEERRKKYSVIMKDGQRLIIDIPCEKMTIKAQIRARLFGRSAWLILLDTNIPENGDEYVRKLLNRIYDPEFYTRVKQGIVLGLGGVRALEALGIAPAIYHLNEGHTAFAAVELVLREAARSGMRDIPKAMQVMKEKIVATKHTIFSEAGTRTRKDDFLRMFGPYCESLGLSAEALFSAGTSSEVLNDFSTTQFLVNSAGRQNGVSAIHVAFEKQVHPQSTLVPITNGVHKNRWQAREFERSIVDWDETKLWDTKAMLRKNLVQFVNEHTGSSLDPSVCTVVWARRFASYKRPEILFTDLKRLKALTEGAQRVQFILSGKAHPADLEAQKIVEYIRGLAENPEWKGRIAYLSDYSIPLAEKLVKGADIWLNTPYRGKEACGTSGMKAALNGALMMSVSDGWVDEVDWKGAGWILPEKDTAPAVYDMLEKEAIPLYYGRSKDGLPSDWLKRMRATINIVETGFTARRMLADYLKKAYNISIDANIRTEKAS